MRLKINRRSKPSWGPPRSKIGDSQVAPVGYGGKVVPTSDVKSSLELARRSSAEAIAELESMFDIIKNIKALIAK